MTQSTDFSLRGLYAALDAQRRARGLSWASATREMGSGGKRRPCRGLSPSTVTGTRTRAACEGDGVLQMIVWLNRTPESFVPGHPEGGSTRARLPDVPPNKVLRFDTQKLYAALDAQRIERKMTWPAVAAEASVAVSSLRHLSQGGRTAFPQVMRILRWLAQPAARFTRAADR